MRVRVTERFRDKITGAMATPGAEMDVDEARGKAMVAAGLAVSLEKPRKAAKQGKEDDE